MTDQISDWPPITADLRADGSLELVVAGMGNHFQDTASATARQAALEHVHELAVHYARPLRVRTTSAGAATGSLIVAPDATFWAEEDPSVVWPLSALSTTTATASAPADKDMATSLFEIGAAAPTRSPKQPRSTKRRSTAVIVVAGAALTVVVTGAIALATAQGPDAPTPAAATATQAVATTAPTTAATAPAPPQLAVRLGKPARGTATLRITSDGAAQTVRVAITHPRRRAEVFSVVVADDSSVRLKVELKPGRYRWAVTPAEGDALTGRLRVLAPKPKVTTPPTVRKTPPPAAPRSNPAPKPKPAPKPRPKPQPKPKKPPIGDIPDGPIGD